MPKPVPAKGELTQRTAGGLHDHLYETFFSDLPRDSKIIDIGCGTGAWLSRLIAAGFRSDMLSGVDLDAASFALENVDFRTFDLNSPCWPLFGANADVITAIEVLEHVQNVGAFFGGVSRLMDDKSVLVITSPNICSLEARIRFFLTGRLPQFDSKGDPTHIYPVYSNCLTRICQAFGLEIFESSSYSANESTRRMYSFPVRIAAAVSAAILPNNMPGDIAIWRVRRAIRQASTNSDTVSRERR